MSYKAKSLAYLICFLISIIMYSQMDETDQDSTNEDVQLVQTTNELPQQEAGNAF